MGNTWISCFCNCPLWNKYVSKHDWYWTLNKWSAQIYSQFDLVYWLVITKECKASLDWTSIIIIIASCNLITALFACSLKLLWFSLLGCIFMHLFFQQSALFCGCHTGFIVQHIIQCVTCCGTLVLLAYHSVLCWEAESSIRAVYSRNSHFLTLNIEWMDPHWWFFYTDVLQCINCAR